MGARHRAAVREFQEAERAPSYYRVARPEIYFQRQLESDLQITQDVIRTRDRFVHFVTLWGAQARFRVVPPETRGLPQLVLGAPRRVVRPLEDLP